MRVGVAQGAGALATALALGALQRVVAVRCGGATPAATATTAATTAATAATEGRRPGAARVRDGVGCALAGLGLRLGLGLGLG